MSWQLVSFGMLLAVLAGGFVWWERSRPPSRLVALVAALAALAVAGRLVFAPVPNLVATTDVALLTGYALGGPPGFAVGALAAPISNIWLGQGPWTAWQMAGWGLVGLAGAGIAAASGRRLGRLGLAIVCGVVGLGYGALLDLSTMVTYGGEQSLDRFVALSTKGIPFNVVHALGNFALAFAAGPALVRLISRYRTRLDFTWRPAAALPVALLGLAVAVLTQFLTGPPAADAKRSTRAAVVSPARQSAAKAVDWLAGEQNDDGGFAAAKGQPSSPAMTGWAMLGLEAAGRNPRDLARGGEDPISYLVAEADRLRSVGDLERTILALVGAGVKPTNFAGRDLVAQLRGKRDGDGSVDGQVNLTAFYVLAMRAAGTEPSRLGRSRRWLTRAQAGDGGWGFQPGAPSDPDSTGAALQAIVAAGQGGKPLAAAVRYLRRSQRPNGGFALSTSGVVNSQSTSWAVQGMVAAGAGGKPRRAALGYIDSLRASDGHFRYSPSSDQTPVWVTAQALLAVNRRAFPLAAVARAAPNEGSDGDGAGSPASAPEPSSTPPSATGPVVTRGSGGGGEGAAGERGSGERRSDTAKSGSGGGGAAQADGGSPAPASEATTAASGTEALPAAPDERSAEAGDSSTLPYVVAGLTALAAALAGGFVWYRNRLP